MPQEGSGCTGEGSASVSRAYTPLCPDARVPLQRQQVELRGPLGPISKLRIWWGRFEHVPQSKVSSCAAGSLPRAATPPPGRPGRSPLLSPAGRAAPFFSAQPAETASRANPPSSAQKAGPLLPPLPGRQGRCCYP